MLSKLLGIFRKPKNNKLNPEANFVVTFDEEWIINKRPNGKIEKVKWNDLRVVIIETNDLGPFAPDLFWILLGENKTGCVFPQGATGEQEILEEMQKRLKGFNNENIIEAMGSTNNNKFLIWKWES
jgi:hypothetical protein